MIYEAIQKTIILLFIMHIHCGYLYPCDLSDTVFFDNTVVKKVIKDIHAIKKGGSIELHQLILSDRHITDALLTAHEKKVHVTVQVSPHLLCYSTKEVNRLEKVGITIIYKHTHEKTILLQQKGGMDRIMYSGSRNFSNKAYFQPEILQRFTDQNGDSLIIDEVTSIWHNRVQKKPCNNCLLLNVLNKHRNVDLILRKNHAPLHQRYALPDKS